MDIFSHALWGATVIRKRNLLWPALLFGAGPDILGGAPRILLVFFTTGQHWAGYTWQMLPDIIKDNYFVWHSIFGCLLVFIGIILFKRKYWFLIFPYLIHIIIDTVTHTGDILYRLLYPFIDYVPSRVVASNWWEDTRLWVASTAFLILVNLVILFIHERKKVKHKT